MKKFWKRKTEEASEPVQEEICPAENRGPVRRAGRWILRHKKALCLLLVVVIAAGAGVLLYQKKQREKAMQERVSTVETALIQKQTLVDSISLSGTVVSADSRSVFTGVEKAEVTKVYVEAGDIVTAGQVICEFDSEDIETSLANARNSQILADYKSDKEYEKVVEAYEKALEGDDDVYDTYSPAQANAKSTWQSAQEALTAAQSAYDRAVADEAEKKAAFEAAEKPDISEEEYGAAKLALRQQENSAAEEIGTDSTEEGESGDSASNQADYSDIVSQYEAYQSLKTAYEEAVKASSTAKTELEKAQSAESSAASSYEKIVEERSNAEDQAEKNLETAADNLEAANMERKYAVDESEQKIEEYEQQLEDCYLTAPMDGMIVSLSVAEGDIYTGGTIFVIADYQNFIVNASVDEYDIGSLEKGMDAAVKIEAVSEEELAATLSYVAPVPTESTGFGSSGSSSYAIEIALKEPNTDLRIGMSAQASVVLEKSEDVLTVPGDCIQTNRQGETVVYVEENGERKEVSVTTGMESDYYTEISGEGLKEGMTVFLSTPLVTESGSQGNEKEGGGLFDMGGLNMGGQEGAPSGRGNGGGMPSGGPSGGGRGGF